MPGMVNRNNNDGDVTNTAMHARERAVIVYPHISLPAAAC